MLSLTFLHLGEVQNGSWLVTPHLLGLGTVRKVSQRLWWERGSWAGLQQAYTLNRRIKRTLHSDEKCNLRRKDTSVFEHAEGFLYDLSLFRCCSLSRSYWFLLKWWELNGVWARFYSSTGVSTIFSSLF